MKKAIHVQVINPDTGKLLTTKPHPWASMTVDNIKIVIDAYKDGIEPRQDSLIEIVNHDQCFQLTPEQLIKAIRYFIAYSDEGSDVVHYPNKFHYIIPDALKPRLIGLKTRKF